MQNIYQIRAYRWYEGKYELTEPYIVAGLSKDDARDALAAHLGGGWKASGAAELCAGSRIPLEERIRIFEKLGFPVLRAAE